MPKFSVIITIYNKEAYLVNTITSVLSQTFQDFEIIVVNDGSTDNSLAAISNFSDDRIRIINQPNKGASAARNTGIKNATTKHLAFLDGDDEWHSHFLEEINILIEKFPLESIYATAIQLKENNNAYPVKYSLSSTKQHQIIDYFKGSMNRTLLSASSIVIKKEAFNIVGFFDETLKSGEDTDMWIRFGLKYPIAFSTRVSANYNQFSDSLSNTSTNTNQKCDFTKFIELEKTHPALKKFIDFNRFSLAIQSKLTNNLDRFLFYKYNIDLNNLNWKQRFLLNQPKWLLKLSIKTKKLLVKNGVLLRILD